MGAAAATGRKRFAPKTSSGTRERMPQCRGRTSRISEGQETYEAELMAASCNGMVRPCSCPSQRDAGTGWQFEGAQPCPTHQLRPLPRWASTSFHVVGLDRRGAIVLWQKWSRGQIEARLEGISHAQCNSTQ